MPLLVCATPIGNLEDVTLRVLRALTEADVVLCEDTRRTRVLLDRHGIRATLVSIEQHREARMIDELLARLEAGEQLALVSDAGLPGVSDPGARLIAAAVEHGVDVSVLPGPSAVETALVASGLIGERYAFVGFLPRTDDARRRLWQELESWTWPTVAFESPNRLRATLESLAAAQPDRRVVVCRELTKLFEEVSRGTASELARSLVEPVRGEITVVIGAADVVVERASADARAAMHELVAAGLPRRKAAAVVARLTGGSANALYRASMEETTSEG